MSGNLFEAAGREQFTPLEINIFFRKLLEFVKCSGFFFVTNLNRVIHPVNSWPYVANVAFVAYMCQYLSSCLCNCSCLPKDNSSNL